MKYSYAFKTIRSTKRLTQKQLGDFAGVSPGYISKIEKGEKIPTLDVVEKVCEGTGIPFPVFALLSSENNTRTEQYVLEINTIKQSLVELLSDGHQPTKA